MEGNLPAMDISTISSAFRAPTGAARGRAGMRAQRPRPFAASAAAMAAFVLLLTAVQAAAGAPKLLNSERIEQKFGSYGIDVLASDASVRVSDLYSLEHGVKVCRTFAVVRYPENVDPRYAAEHREILAGGSIGAVFKKHGWTVTKKNLYFGTLAPSPKVAKLMHDDSGRRLAVHVYALYASKGAATLRYATIAEVHSPDYLTLDAVRGIYGAPEPATPETKALVERMLEVTAARMR